MFTLVSLVGHCAILAQIIGEEPSGEPVPSFFAVYMITNEGKPACGFGEARFLQRICKNKNRAMDLVGFCQGYSACCGEGRRTVMPQDWRFKGTIEAKDVTIPDEKEKKRLLAWPDSQD